MTAKSDLTSRQRAALEALATGKTQTEAAQAAGVQARTIRRYLADPAFALALRATQDQSLAQALTRMVAGTDGALETLSKIMIDGETAPGVRVRAADLWLSHTWCARELQDLTERVAALEERINEHQK